MVKEDFLYFLWQFRHFDQRHLKSQQGECIEVIHPGYRNFDAGPDFLQAKVKINGLEWNGAVEMHVKPSDWYQHQHQEDPNYVPVILHVCWLEGPLVYRQGQADESIPQIHLQDKTDPLLLQRYESLLGSMDHIPCEPFKQQWDPFSQSMTLEKMALKRLMRKSKEILIAWEKSERDWEQTAFRILCRSFGFGKNQEVFEQLAMALPVKLLKKHAGNRNQVEALLFGQSGLLEGSGSHDPYVQELKKEYQFLSHKYGLKESKLEGHLWKFLRLRPANFPTLRMAQMAAFINSQANIFSDLFEIQRLEEAKTLLRKKVSPYWDEHYHFGRASIRKKGMIGSFSLELVLVNALVPLMAAYGKHQDNDQLIQRALDFWQKLKPEKNKITDKFKEMGWAGHHALDSQGQIELYKNHCQQKKCLQCPLGIKILGRKDEAKL